MESILEKTIMPGDRWSADICKGRLIKFTALGPGANMALLLYNERNLSEHYNAPDTIKAQHTFYLTKGHALLSDRGRALASIVEDTVGWNDTVTGYTTRKMTDDKYGFTCYQNEGNDYLKSGQENLINELIKNGMSKRDLMPPVNLFSKIDADQKGNLIFVSENSKVMDSITIRTEMDVYMVVSNTPNPLDPSVVYPSVPIKIEVAEADLVTKDDEIANSSEYTLRAFENTWEYNMLLGI